MSPNPKFATTVRAPLMMMPLFLMISLLCCHGIFQTQDCDLWTVWTRQHVRELDGTTSVNDRATSEPPSSSSTKSRDRHISLD
jgi:hypothetical protein